MLELKIETPRQIYNEQSGEFLYIKPQTIRMEHSLLSIAKWESKWHKPFLDSKEKSSDELIDYIKCMTVTQGVDPNVYYALAPSELSKIESYISDPMTATWFSEEENKKPKSHRVITAEIIYYQMVSLGIPLEHCEKWHINRLLTLIKVCNVENSPKKKMSKKDIIKRNKMLNDARRAKLHSTG